jgi:hypothetical protein
MRFGTWNVKSLYRSGSLNTVSRQFAKCKLELVGVQEVRSAMGVTEPADDYIFYYGNENATHHLGTRFFVYKGITECTVSFSTPCSWCLIQI